MAFIPGGTGTASSFPDGFTGSPLANVETITATKVLGVTGTVTFTGFAGGAGGKILYVGVSNTSVTLNHNDAASSAGNRIICLTGANTTRTNGGFTLIYDANLTRWLQVG